MSSVGRNDPCPCGSGKKHKHCCLGKPVNCGPCDGPGNGPNGRCGQPSCGAGECKICGKRYAHCHSHHEVVQTMIQGHVMRVHPESLPTDKFDELLADDFQMAGLRQQQSMAPELWKRFFEYVEERRQAGSASPNTSSEVDKIAQDLRKAARKSPTFRGTERHVHGYKVILSYADAEELIKLSAQAPPSVRPPTEADLSKVHWHLSASWRRHGEPPADAAQMLADLVAALGVPEDRREGEQPVIAIPRVTHWIWTEERIEA